MKKNILITGGSGFIGTNLIELFKDKIYNLINFDKSKPYKDEHLSFWFQGNLLDIEDIKSVLNKHKPSIIIHLAARTDCNSENLEEYIDNTKGTQNLIEIVKESTYVEQVIVTSTQYVYKSKINPFPINDTDYKPHTTYGRSKVITEEIVRNADLHCSWTIVRPCNVWGPWHMRYPNELWKLIDKGFYVHASKKEVIRTYGYVKNVVHQINEIINAPIQQVDKKTYYLGDLPIDSYIWLNGISKELRSKSISRIPNSLFIFPAFIGDILKKVDIPSPIYTTRYKNMIEDYYAPTNITINEFGLSHPNLYDNINETMEWIKNEGKQFFPYWSKKYHSGKILR